METGEWYYFETTYTRLGGSNSTAVDYDVSIAEASADGTIGAVIRNYTVPGQEGGHGNADSTNLNDTIYAGFKGHDAYPESAAVMDNFYVSTTGVSLLPDSSLAITRIVYDHDEATVELTWRARQAASYIAKVSPDMTD